MPQYPPLDCKVTYLDSYGRGIGNVVIEGTRFYGKPNFSGVLDRFKNDARQFTVLLPPADAEKMAAMGYLAKVRQPQTPEEDFIGHIKVSMDFKFHDDFPGDVLHERGPDIWVISNGNRRRLNSRTVGQLDRARNIDQLDLEIRGWEWDRDENPGKYTAKLVTLVAVMRPSLLEEKYPEFPEDHPENV